MGRRVSALGCHLHERGRGWSSFDSHVLLPLASWPPVLGRSLAPPVGGHNRTGVAVQILLPTALGAVKASGSGRTPSQSLVVSNLFHTVVLGCQGAFDPIV